MRILFAPYLRGNPYQALLTKALHRYEIKVSFLTDYYWGLPLCRGVRAESPQIVHVHWPEDYFPQRGDRWDWLRVAGYPIDCWLTARFCPMVLTAHNFIAHNREDERGVFRNARCTAQNSSAIFAHSGMARQMLRERFSISERRIHIIPHGDLAVPLGEPAPHEEARAQLRLPLDAKICLVFGTISPYKGSDELVRYWVQNRLPYRLVVIGEILSKSFARTLHDLAQGCTTVDLRLLNECLDDEALRLWLSASDCAIFNYREIFTSGAATLARSYGIPLLIPRRLAVPDLDEPHPHVLRFETLDTDFAAQLERALATPCDYGLAGEWRRKTSWDRVAELTAMVYRDVARETF
jgi:beta-1,4-mannosyltransferase